MSKPIKMTDQYANELRAAFEQVLQQVKMADGKINFTKTFKGEDRRATIFISPEAWAKMVMLIKNCDNEIAWHGAARRMDEKPGDAYLVYDIMVYPQTVTGATVEMDENAYAKWLIDHAQDERFDHICMQGHSHVNMQVMPSPVDLQHQEDILNMLKDDGFYIFMIWNKSFQCNSKIYDMQKNVLFENGDVTVALDGGSEDLEAFLKSSMELVKTKTFAQSPYTSTFSTYDYDSYGTPRFSYGKYAPGVSTTAPYNPVSKPVSSIDHAVVKSVSGGTTAKSKEKNTSPANKNTKKGKAKVKVDSGWYGSDLGLLENDAICGE